MRFSFYENHNLNIPAHMTGVFRFGLFLRSVTYLFTDPLLYFLDGHPLLTPDPRSLTPKIFCFNKLFQLFFIIGAILFC